MCLSKGFLQFYLTRLYIANIYYVSYTVLIFTEFIVLHRRKTYTRWLTKQDKMIANLCHKDMLQSFTKFLLEDFPDGSVVKKSPANAEEMGLIPDPGRSHTPQGN